jgi:exodeoxyribonuclease V alpha subunit
MFSKGYRTAHRGPGNCRKKTEDHQGGLVEHRAIRDVMMFLQSHGISTLFAVRIYKQYGDQAIAYVTEDPYRLARDFYGIGFFSADKVALSIGLATDSRQRIMAGIAHVLAASRDFGHCYLTERKFECRSMICCRWTWASVCPRYWKR